MSWMRWLLLGQLVFFAGWTAREELIRLDAPLLVLETRPVDPRDLWSGQYMDLSYEISRLQELTQDLDPGEVAVRLVPHAETRVGGEFRWTYRAAEVRVGLEEPLPAPTKTSVWVKGHFDGARVLYGIERYYFSEVRAQELGGLSAGQFFVEVKASKAGELRVERLLTADGAIGEAPPRATAP